MIRLRVARAPTSSPLDGVCDVVGTLHARALTLFSMQSDAVAVWNQALDAAEEHLDVPQLLDAEDMANFTPDDKSGTVQYIALAARVL